MDGQKIAVILAVISLIYIIAKLCADTPVSYTHLTLPTIA